MMWNHSVDIVVKPIIQDDPISFASLKDVVMLLSIYIRFPIFQLFNEGKYNFDVNETWNETDNENEKNRIRMTDQLIGTAVIDLSLIDIGISTINGWYHIYDSVHNSVGQIKLSVMISDDKNKNEVEGNEKGSEILTYITDSPDKYFPDNSSIEEANYDLSNSFDSREKGFEELKRKMTELDKLNENLTNKGLVLYDDVIITNDNDSDKLVTLENDQWKSNSVIHGPIIINSRNDIVAEPMYQDIINLAEMKTIRQIDEDMKLPSTTSITSVKDSEVYESDFESIDPISINNNSNLDDNDIPVHKKGIDGISMIHNRERFDSSDLESIGEDKNILQDIPEDMVDIEKLSDCSDSIDDLDEVYNLVGIDNSFDNEENVIVEESVDRQQDKEEVLNNMDETNFTFMISDDGIIHDKLEISDSQINIINDGYEDDKVILNEGNNDNDNDIFSIDNTLDEFTKDNNVDISFLSVSESKDIYDISNTNHVNITISLILASLKEPLST